MKLRKILILSLGMALGAAGAIGSALAVTTNSAESEGHGSFDKAIYLYWGANESTKPVSLKDLDELAPNVPQYSYLSVTPSQSATVTGSVTVSFVLAAADNHGIKGVTVEVYKTSSLLNDETVAAGLPASPITTLAIGNLTASDSWNVGTGVAAYYAFKVMSNGTPQEGGAELGGTVTISQEYSTTVLGA